MEDNRRIVDEERLKRLAAARKKALMVRQQKAELKKAKKQEEQESFQKEYEEKVLKKQSPPKKVVEEKVEETDKDIYEEQMPVKPASSEDDYPIEMVAKAKPRKKAQAPALTQPQEPNYKQMYYQHKLAMLQAKQQQEQFNQHYAQLPPYHHTVDIAKNSIKERVDKVVYDEVWKQLFSC